MTDIATSLVQGQIRELRADYSILKRDYDALREELADVRADAADVRADAALLHADNDRLKTERDDWYMRALKAEDGNERLRAAAKAFEEGLSAYCDGPERDALRRALESKP